VRGGTVSTTLRKHEQTVRFLVVRNAIPQKKEQIPHLEEEKARFLFLEGRMDG
jgi:hypothetical protein